MICIYIKQQKLWTQELELKIEELQRKHNEEIRKVQADKLSQSFKVRQFLSISVDLQSHSCIANSKTLYMMHA